MGEAFDQAGHFLGSARADTFLGVATKLAQLDGVADMTIVASGTESFAGRLLIWLCEERERAVLGSERWRTLADVSTAIHAIRSA